jgi:hypothetical protein
VTIFECDCLTMRNIILSDSSTSLLTWYIICL